MSRYKVDKIYYPNRWQRTEDVVADAYSFAQRKASETIEIAAHLIASAHKHNDDELYNVGLDLMRIANSPCRFMADNSAAQATDSNNRPPISTTPKIPAELLNSVIVEDEEWDDTYDYIFDKRVKPLEIKRAIGGIKKYPARISPRRFYYVTYRILDVINYFSDKVTPSDFLRWINLHFNCGWIDDNGHRKQFVFALEGSSKKLEDQHPSYWDEKTIRGGSGKQHHQLAVTLKNTFTETMVNGIAVGNSESFEHLRDRGQFLRNTYHIKGNEYFIPDDAYINNGQ